MLLHPKLTKRLIIFLQICLICSITVICFLFVLYLTSEKNQVKEFFVENLSKQEKDRMHDLTTRLAKVTSQQQDIPARLYDPQIDNYETLENMENRDEATMDTIYIDDYAQEYQKFGEPSERSRYETAKSDDGDDRNTIIRNFNAQNDNVALLENIENIDKIEYFDRIIVDHGDPNNKNKFRDNLDQEDAPVVYTTKTLKPTKKNKDKKRQKAKKLQNKLNRYLSDNESDDGEFSGSGDDMEAFDDIDSYTVAKSKKWHRQLNRLNRQKQQANRFRMEGKSKNYYKVYTSVEDDDEREAHVEQVFKERIAKQKQRTKSPVTSKFINTNVVLAADSWVKSSTTTTTVAPSSSSVVPQLAAATLKTGGTLETRARRIKSNVEKSEEKARKLLLCEESGNYGELCRMLFKGDMSNN